MRKRGRLKEREDNERERRTRERGGREGGGRKGERVRMRKRGRFREKKSFCSSLFLIKLARGIHYKTFYGCNSTCRIVTMSVGQRKLFPSQSDIPV